MALTSKQTLRKEISERLLSMPDSDLKKKSDAICKKIVETREFKNSDVVMLYLPMPYEVDIEPLIESCWQSSKRVLLPRILWQQKKMIAVEINSLGAELETSRIKNLKQPASSDAADEKEIDLIITPGLGFDMNGNRLGRGGGYYDKFFGCKKLRAIKLAVAFDEQIVDEIPTQEHDLKIDCIVTDKVMEHFGN